MWQCKVVDSNTCSCAHVWIGTVKLFSRGRSRIWKMGVHWKPGQYMSKSKAAGITALSENNYLPRISPNFSLQFGFSLA